MAQDAVTDNVFFQFKPLATKEPVTGMVGVDVEQTVVFLVCEVANGVEGVELQ